MIGALMKTADILVKNVVILCFDANMNIFENGYVAITGKSISAIGSMPDSSEWHAEEVIDGKGMIVLPGFINGHTHAGMSYFKGMADDMPVIQWLQEKIWPAEGKFMNAEFVKLGVEHAAAEMIKSGITTFNDMYFYSREAAESCEMAGIRALLGEGVLNYPVAMHKNADEMINYSVQSQKHFKSDLVSFAIAPHAIYTCNKENLLKASETAKKENMNLHIHLAETQEEVDLCLHEHGMRPVEYLDKLGMFHENTIIAHGIYLNDKELEILAKRGTSIAVNTISNLKLASGFAPIKRYQAAGVNFCLGTDGVASNNRLDMFAEIATTARLHKALNSDASFLPAESILKACIKGGNIALNQQDKLGAIEVDKYADLIIVDMNTIESQPMYDSYSHLVYSTSSEQVKHVIINGKVVMRDRKILTLNEDELIDRAKEYRKRIKN
jgi:5-methylthioadenosine/S-adenosylhomocysteine deaminase